MNTKKSKTVDEAIVAYKDQIETLRKVKSIFPDAEISSLEDGSRCYMSHAVLGQEIGFHFVIQDSGSAGRKIVIRPYLEIKRRNKTPLRVYAVQSAVVPSFMHLTELLNKAYGSCKLSEFPESCATLFGEVITAEVKS